MKLFTLALGYLGTNCYVIPTDKKNAVVIDPASADEVLSLCEREGLKITAIILTHGHFDHFSGAAEIIEKTGAKVYSSLIDKPMFESYDKSWAEFMPMLKFTPITPDITFEDGETFAIDNLEFKVVATPGHTKGSCFLFCGDSIFVGDTIFAGSVGRVDGFSGSYFDQKETLCKIAKMQGDYKLYPGHGEKSTLADEQKYNEYIRMTCDDAGIQ